MSDLTLIKNRWLTFVSEKMNQNFRYKLARQGFYKISETDLIKCIFCNVITSYVLQESINSCHLNAHL